MKIELKRVAHMERCSEETNCYAAQVWVDGIHVADVSNDGHGGCDHQHPAKGFTYKDIEALNQRIAAEFPPAFEIEGKPHPADLETVCGDLLTDWLIGKDLKRALGRYVLFIKTAEPGAVFQIPLKQKGRKFTVEQIKTQLLAKHGNDGVLVLNTLQFTDALDIYKREGRPA